MARFMCRWLKGEDKPVTEENWPIEKDADLWCTRSGQVLEDLRGKSVFDLNAALAAEYAKKRAEKQWKPEALRKEVARVIALPDEVPVLKTADAGVVDADRYAIHKQVLRAESGVSLPALLLEPKKTRTPRVLNLHVHEAGAAQTVERVTKLASVGLRYMAVDLRGFGETAPAVAKDGKAPTFGVEFKESFLGFHLNRPLLGQRVTDLLGVINAVDKDQTLGLTAIGSAGPVALHAALLSDRVKAVTIDNSLVSWHGVLRTPISHNQLANVVPGVLKVYDLPDLAAAIAPRPLTILRPVDAAGKPLSKEAAEEAYKGVREAYKEAGAEDKFTLTVAPK
jgi:hypothetical protein